MIKRDEVEEMLIGCGEPPLNTKDDLCLVPATTLAELARTWLAVDAAPTGHLRDSIDFDGDTGMDESHARALVGQRIRLVPEADSGGDRG